MKRKTCLYRPDVRKWLTLIEDAIIRKWLTLIEDAIDREREARDDLWRHPTHTPARKRKS